MTNAESRPPMSQRVLMFLARARFFTASALVHSILIVIGGGVVLFQHIEEPPDFVAESGSLLAADVPAAAPVEPPPVTPEVKPSENAPVLSAPSLSALTSTATNSTFKMAAASAPAAVGRSMDAMTEKMGDAMKGLPSSSPGAKGGTMMKFFGVQAKATSVVFVVDISGSMVMGKKSVKSYEVLEKEVIQVIRGMAPLDLFGIVAFSRDAESYKPQLVRASTDEKDRAIQWLKRMSPEIFVDPKAKEEKKAMHKGTRADLGLAKAFELKPAAIFFVSDGEPTGAQPAEILKQVKAAQGDGESRTAVHAIAFLADSGQKFMESLAKENGGTFREVNPKVEK